MFQSDSGEDNVSIDMSAPTNSTILAMTIPVSCRLPQSAGTDDNYTNFTDATCSLSNNQ